MPWQSVRSTIPVTVIYAVSVVMIITAVNVQTLSFIAGSGPSA